MLELIFLLFVVPSRIRAAARPRGLNTIRWVFTAVFVWIATELLVASGVLAVLITSSVLFEVPSESTGQTIMLFAYLVAITAGMYASDRVRKHIERKPLVEPRSSNRS